MKFGRFFAAMMHNQFSALMAVVALSVFPSTTLSPTFRQKRRRLSRQVEVDISCSTPQQRIAIKHGCAHKTVVRNPPNEPVRSMMYSRSACTTTMSKCWRTGADAKGCRRESAGANSASGYLNNQLRQSGLVIDPKPYRHIGTERVTRKRIRHGG